MFLATFGLEEWQVRNWVEQSNHGMTEVNRRQDTKEDTVRRPSKVLMVFFLENLNKMPSHYCRRDSDNLYLEQSFANVTDL